MYHVRIHVCVCEWRGRERDNCTLTSFVILDFGHLASWFPRSSGFYLFTFSISCFGAASDSYVADISILCRALLLLLLVLLNPAPPFTITKLRLSQLLGYESTEALSFSDGNALPRLHCMIFRVAFNLRASGFLWEKKKRGREGMRVSRLSTSLTIPVVHGGGIGCSRYISYRTFILRDTGSFREFPPGRRDSSDFCSFRFAPSRGVDFHWACLFWITYLYENSLTVRAQPILNVS